MKKADRSQRSGRRTFLKQVATATTLGSVNLSSEATVAGPPSARSSHPPIAFPRVFRGRQLAMIAFPLGGVGTGSISLGGRGDLRDWEIFNRPQKGNSLRYTFASIWAKSSGSKSVTRVLEARIRPPYEGPSGLGWASAPGLPRLDRAVFTGEFPFAKIDFEDDSLPVNVSLEAFNPFIPLDPEASSLPLAVLRYRVCNPGRTEVKVSLAFNVDNPVGDDGRINEYRQTEKLKGLYMHNPSIDGQDPLNGSFALCVTSDSGEITHVPSWGELTWALPVESFWEDLSEDGLLHANHHLPAFPDYQATVGRLKVGSICASSLLPAESEKSVTFLLTWHFPNRTPEGCGWDAPEGEEKTVIGNLYCERFADAWSAVQYAVSNLDELEGGSREFLQSVKTTTLPAVVLDAAMSNLSTLHTNTCFQTKDGRFHGFEGCKEKGCCFGSCTHVWNYETMLSSLFPSYSRSMLDSWLGFGTDERGLMDFRYYLPFGKKRFGHAAADGQMGVLIKLYLDWRLSGDMSRLRTWWPKAKKALEFAWIKDGWDADRDGVMEGCQHNTYDVQFLGPNPLSGILYLGALRACEEMARAIGDREAADQYSKLFKNGSAWIDSNLFNEEYYIQKIQGRPFSQIADGLLVFETDATLPGGSPVGDARAPLNQMGKGCLADQLFGQTLAHIANLGHLLDPSKIGKALASISRYNFKPDLSEHRGVLRTYALNDEAGLVICDYSHRPAPKRPFFFYREVWSGIEYQVAAHMFFEGKHKQGLDLVEAVRNRHDGERRNPWNEPECGYHYSRALASWSCVLALCGFNYRGHDALVSLSPRMESNPAIGFWCVPTGWGSYSRAISGETATIEIWARRGRLRCRSIELGSLGSSRFTSALAGLGRNTLSADLTADDLRIVVKLSRRVDIVPGKSLWLRLS